MPSRSKAQHNYFEMIAHDKQAAKRTGVSQKVARDFVSADKKRGKSALHKLPRKKT